MLAATRHLVCTAARPAEAATFVPAWRTETAMALAHGIVADGAFDRMPILADALEEAACDDLTLLRHCRECQQHTAACWVLGDLFDRPPLAEPVRLTDAEVRREVERVTGRAVLPADDAPRKFVGRGLLWRLIPAAVLLTVVATVRVGMKTPPTVSPAVNFPTFKTASPTPAR